MPSFMKKYSSHPERKKVLHTSVFQIQKYWCCQKSNKYPAYFYLPYPYLHLCLISILVSISFPPPCALRTPLLFKPWQWNATESSFKVLLSWGKGLGQAQLEVLHWSDWSPLWTRLAGPQKEVRNMFLGTGRRGYLLGHGRSVNKIVVSSYVQRRKCKRQPGIRGRGRVGTGSPMWGA